jgi:magnesium chelatase family protein
MIYGTFLRKTTTQLVRVRVTTMSGPATVLGLPERAVGEAQIRLRANALTGTVVVEGLPAGASTSGLDLALAAALGGASDGLYHGSLSLAGDVREERGAYGAELAAEALGVRCVLVHPRRPGSRSAATLAEALGGGTPVAQSRSKLVDTNASDLSFADLTHPLAQRALLVAAATRRNVLFIGLPGSGMTLAARRLLCLLPALEGLALEDACLVADAAGLPITGRRPFRAPHYTCSSAALAGSDWRPGEVTLARHGVLFIDEAPEVMREPWRALETALAQEPDAPIVVGTAAPCACVQSPCRCTQDQRQSYQRRLGERASLFGLVVPMARDRVAPPITDGPARVCLARRILLEGHPGDGLVLTARALAALDARQSATPEDLAQATELHVGVTS